MGDASIDSIALVMKDGGEISYIAPEDAERMKAAMERVKATIDS